jgi:hypothetical protein
MSAALLAAGLTALPELLASAVSALLAFIA